MVNYIRHNAGQGVRIFFDGEQVKSDTTKGGGPLTSGDGRIVVGRINTEEDKGYTSIQVDELMFFNSSLTTGEIRAIFNTVY